jgi:hypothetical protein
MAKRNQKNNISTAVYTKYEKVKKISKKLQFQADFKSIEKVFKKCTKKSYEQNKIEEMSKSGKSAYFRHVFANNFFGTFFKNLFNGLVGHISTFFKL